MPLGAFKAALMGTAGVATFSASGGTETTATISGTSYKIHTFTSTDDFVVTGGSGTVDILVIAGGGTGAFAGGTSGGYGGGAGGGMYLPAKTITAGTHTATVGAGGSASGGGSNPIANDGNNSSLGSLATAYKGQKGNGGSSGNYGSGGAGTSTFTVNMGHDGGSMSGGGWGETGDTDGAGHGGDGETEGSGTVYDWTKNDSSSTATFVINGTGNIYGGGGSGGSDKAGGDGGGGSA